MASRSADLSGMGGLGIDVGVSLAISSIKLELLVWKEFLRSAIKTELEFVRSSMAVRSRSRIEVSVVMGAGVSVGGNADDVEVSVIVVGLEVLWIRWDLRCVAVSSAFFLL